MTSPSSTASSPIPCDAYFADLYPLASPVHSRSPSPICPSPPPAPSQKSIRDHHNHKHNPTHTPYPSKNTTHHPNHPNQPTRPPPYRPRLEFAAVPQKPYRPSLSFLPSGGTSPASTSASPLTPESPVGGSWGEGAGGVEEKYIFREAGEKEVKEERGDRVSAQVQNEETSAESGCAAGVSGEADGEGGGAGEGGGGFEEGGGGVEGEGETVNVEWNGMGGDCIIISVL
ncbi:hypothetical protein V502_04540 [Pseudogymnoascus sp. VKM F-4520 (FW-2644)]|nr:hypothetical protein V502_04540 [Pseudogymnoascus sp. VKM F-4520 (FW-2644)]